jgi:hypothetical protein
MSARAHGILDPLAHFGGGLVAERETEDLLGRNASGEQVLNPGGKRSGFSGPRPGVDRSRPIVCLVRRDLILNASIAFCFGSGASGRRNAAMSWL